MNIVEVQDNLKNFSQDQLINEINQPSGMVPQFLVLTELGRRNRIKQDMEGRQAQNQPTVAQEVVSAAGVPQGGIMDMARSMAPKSSIEQNDAVDMMDKGGKVSKPRNRFEAMMAYLRSLGADSDEEVEEATGKSLMEIINFGGDYRPVKKADGGVVKMAKAGSPKREVVYKGRRYITDGLGRVFNATRAGSKRKGSEVRNPEIISAVLNIGPNVQPDVGGIANISANLDTFSPVSTGISPVNTPDPMFTSGMQMPLIAASEDKVDESDLPTYDGGMPFPLVKDENFTLKPYEGPSIETFDGTGTGSFENIDDVSNIPEFTADTEVERSDLRSILEGQAIQYPNQESSRIKGLGEINKILPDSVSTQAAPDLQSMIPSFIDQPTLPSVNIDNTSNIPDFSTTVDSAISRNMSTLKQSGALDAEQESLGADTFANLAAEQSLMDEGAKIAAAMDAADPLPPIDKKITDQLIDPTKKDPEQNSAISDLESEIANMLKQNEEDREKDKYLALAKMGLALMSSSQPTFGGALGEAGMVGLDDLQASRKSYRDDKITLLDAKRKLEQARASAASKDKSGLTGTNIVSRLNNIQTRKTGLLQKIAELENPTVPSINPEKTKQSIEILKREVADLSVKEQYFQSLLGGIGSLSVDLDATAN